MMGESRDFEYDGEDTETDEMSYEMDEAGETDEDVESDGEYFETDEDTEAEASDEAEWSAGEASDESEAVDESDGEIDEALDEAVAMSASARLRADRDRNRRASWSRRIAADQRVEAKRAAQTQQSITRQIQSVKPPAPAKVYSAAPVRGPGSVMAILPNGRRSRMQIIPQLAPISEVNRLRAAITVNDKRQAKALANQSRAIARLAAAQAAAVKKLTAEQVKSDKDLRKRLVEGDNRLDKRIAKELSGGSGVFEKHGKRIMRALKRQRQRSIMNTITIAASLPFWAKYGNKELLSRENVTLGVSTLGWLMADELVDQFGPKSGTIKGGANAISYLAPVGNGATLFFLLDKRQHERLVSGITSVPAAGTIAVDLTANIGSKSVDDFKKNQHAVLTTVTAGAAGTDVIASVNNGILTLNVNPPAATTVAWTVDTYPV